MHLLVAILILAAQPAPQAPLRDLQVSVLPESPAQGQLVVVEVRGARGGDRISGTFLGKPLRFYLDGYKRIRALAGIPLETEPGGAPLQVMVTPRGHESILHGVTVIIRAGDFDEQELRVNPKFVKPPEKHRARIERERAEMKAIWEAPATRRKWRGPFVWPRKDVITSEFGLRRSFNGELQSRHRGLDIDGSTGSPVVAIGAGRVVMVADRYYSGGTVVVDHGLHLFSLYFHLKRTDVRVGQRIEKGASIGGVGRSGRATGPHLHISTKVEEVNFDPRDLFGLHELTAKRPGPPRPGSSEETGR